MLEAGAMGLTCLYCDDVRIEADGRSSILGWYGQDLLKVAGPFPVVVHNLAVVVLLRLPALSEPSNCKLEMLLGDEVRYSVTPTAAEIQSMLADARAAPHLNEALSLRFVMKFPNLPISEPCALYFRATVNDGQVIGNSLVIRVN